MTGPLLLIQRTWMWPQVFGKSISTVWASQLAEGNPMRRTPFLLDAAGIVLIATGAFLWSTVAGFVVAGLGLIGISWLSEREDNSE
jgi:hypothetical protein